jgi:alcohol dehydrogenase class IV
MASIALPRKMLVGAGTASKVGPLLASLGLRKPLFVADPFYAKNETVLNKVTTGVSSYDAFFDIIPDPTTDSVDRCLRKLKSSSFDSIVALGGGSAMVRLKPGSEARP